MADKLADNEKATGKKEAAETTEKTTRRKPSNIPRIFESGDAETVRAEIFSTYRDRVSEQFANDLLAFVEKAMKGDYVG